ncbi:MAG: hypothetical protein RMJ52_09595 [Gemmataceae bacterium]|nr:hypothetical protein [Gemmataceae bacterium]
MTGGDTAGPIATAGGDGLEASALVSTVGLVGGKGSSWGPTSCDAAAEVETSAVVTMSGLVESDPEAVVIGAAGDGGGTTVNVGGAAGAAGGTGKGVEIDGTVRSLGGGGRAGAAVFATVLSLGGGKTGAAVLASLDGTAGAAGDTVGTEEEVGLTADGIGLLRAGAFTVSAVRPVAGATAGTAPIVS